MGWQDGGGAPPGRVELGLGEEQRGGEVGAGQVGVAEVGAEEVGAVEDGVPQVGGDQHRAAQVGADQVVGPEVLADQVVPGVRRPVAADRAAHLAQGLADQHGQPVELGVEDVLGPPRGATGHPLPQPGQLRAGRQRGGLVEQHQHLVQPLDHGEHGEHLGAAVGAVPPGRAAVDDLGDVLAGAEALVGRAAPHPRLAQGRVDGAPVGVVEVAAGLAGVLGEGEAVRRPERQRDTAQADALRTVRLESGHQHMDTVLA